jgi:hypothetical protein
MNIVGKVINTIRGLDGRILFAFVISGLWLLGGAWFVFHVGDWQPEEKFSMESVGSFLEGVFAPLAFSYRRMSGLD